MKKCPYCAEEIQDEAIVCRYCGRDLKPLPEKKKTSPLALILILLILGVCAIAFILSQMTSPGTTSIQRPLNTKVQLWVVTYEIDGTAKNASLVWENEQGGTEMGDYKIPFNKRMTGFTPGDFLYLSAQNLGDRGTVICRILVNNEVYKESKSEGAYKIATCSGSL